MNFNAIIKPHVVPAVAERFCVRGERTTNDGRRKTYVRCVFEITNGDGGQILKMVEGGVTGFESFYFSGKYAMPDILDKMGEKGWAACFSGMGYDKLEIEAVDMKAVAAWIRFKELNEV